MLTKYDEYPVHQAASSFAEIPSTDYAWSDGYYFTFYNPSKKLEIFMSLRVHPNSDVVGAFVGIVREGRQRTIRLSRRWRPSCDTSIGPFLIDFVEPLKRIRLRLDNNDSSLSFDVDWIATGAPVEEAHRLFVVNGRRVTDQCRYVQAGVPSGWVQFGDERIEVGGYEWGGLRDHSWGLYFETEPLKPQRRWLPDPRVTRSFDSHPHLEEARLAFFIWGTFTTEDYSGVLWVYEDENGNRADRFASPQAMPFAGAIDRRSDGERFQLRDIGHELRFEPGNRRLAGGEVTAVDTTGGKWRLELLEIGGPPWIYWPGGAWPGAWRDGGTWSTYRGEEVAAEWDEVDLSPHPVEYRSGPEMPSVKVSGIEFASTLRLTDPSGRQCEGTMHPEVFFDGRYVPYGFESDGYAVVVEGPYSV